MLSRHVPWTSQQKHRCKSPPQADPSISLDQLLELLGDGAAAELVAGTMDPAASGLRRDTTEDHTIKQRVSSQAVISVHTTGHLACSVETRDGLAVLAQHGGICVDLQATHAVVNHLGCGNLSGMVPPGPPVGTGLWRVHWIFVLAVAGKTIQYPTPGP